MEKISVISGGSGGLGLEIADLLVKSGKNVLVLGRNTDKLARADLRLNKSGNRDSVRSMKCNIGNEEEVTNLGNSLRESQL